MKIAQARGFRRVERDERVLVMVDSQFGMVMPAEIIIRGGHR